LPAIGSATISPATQTFLALCRETSGLGDRHRRLAVAVYQLIAAVNRQKTSAIFKCDKQHLANPAQRP
jgi:hypothetical protein